MKKIVNKGVEETVYYEKLPNGLDIYMYPSETAKNFYLAYNVRFGSVDTEFKSARINVSLRFPMEQRIFWNIKCFKKMMDIRLSNISQL